VASSNQSEHAPAHANDGGMDSRWTAVAAGANQWWQADLGEVRPLRYLALDFEREEKNCGYQVKVSTDASTWQTIVTKPTSRDPRWGGPTQIFHDVDAKARHVRIEFTEMLSGAWASIKEFAAYPQRAESAYYDVTYTYRLRWNDVVYEPGELKAVAYKADRPIGEAIMRTAGKPQRSADPDRKTSPLSGLCTFSSGPDDQDALSAGGHLWFKVDGRPRSRVGNNPLSWNLSGGHRKLSTAAA
jgi:hypothetical protein